ncbi:hypothetical protein BJ878DRAFT_519373 [Calycina marina]|uniref:VLRF1 domain-containing protein n=1 Tax=Calycina marina TaxID=1763456 RepID=A0A9P7YXK8_9HELO|nr:hypothetical protein BJ878DRAFT_519373 [Calycina marina]
MDQRKEDITRRPLFVYNLPQDILSTLALKDYNETGIYQTIVDEAQDSTSDAPKDTTTVGSKACSLCRVTFPTVEEQRSHIRSDLHAYNLKQKIRGGTSVTEGDFEKLVGDLNESLSGSDSEDSEDDENGHMRKETTLSALLKKTAAISSNAEDPGNYTSRKNHGGPGKAPLYWFTTSYLPTNTYLGFYKAIFTNIEQNDSTILQTIQSKQLVPKPQLKIQTNPSNGVSLPESYKDPHVFMCMIGGGHFAAMIVSLLPKQQKGSGGSTMKEAIVLAHKTFHRYTTRRKQGGAQSSNDASNGAAHSAGSSLRRYNEQALTEEVRLLLFDWKGMIDTSELLFIRATGNTNRRTLFGPYDGQVLRQNDPRIRGFPFNTKRPTQNELMRSFVELTRVKVLSADEAAIAAAKEAAEQAKRQAEAKANKPAPAPISKISEEEENLILHTTQIQALIRRLKVPALQSYLKSNELSPDFRFYPPDHHAPTPLHLAASQNLPPLVSGLLLKSGASPLLLNGDFKTPFDLAGDRATRDAFRIARSELGESAFAWSDTHIPSPLSKTEAVERDALEKKQEAEAEELRREAEAQRLKKEGPKIAERGALGKAQEKGRMLALGQKNKTAQEKREEEARGLTPEMRMKLERERRARAAEDRIKKMGGG